MRNFIITVGLFAALWSKVVGQIPTTIFFSYDNDKVSEKSTNTLQKIPLENLEKVILIGHCDSTGSFEYNYGLSMRRANNTKIKLHELGFSPAQWQIIGKSFSSPCKTYQKEKNRRVEIIPVYNDEDLHHISLYKITDLIPYIITYQKGHLAEVSKKDSLQRLAPKKKYKIENLHFVPNKAIMLEESYPSMMALFLTMQANPTLAIKIEGHTNGVRTKKTQEWHNETSAARAASTKDALVSMGISPDRINTIGYGCQHMLYPNGTTKEELKKNRRVEMKVIKM